MQDSTRLEALLTWMEEEPVQGSIFFVVCSRRHAGTACLVMHLARALFQFVLLRIVSSDKTLRCSILVNAESFSYALHDCEC